MWLLWISLFLFMIFIFTNYSTTFKFYIKMFIACIYTLLLPACCFVFFLFNPGSSQNLVILQFFTRLLGVQWVFGIDVKTEDWDNLMNVKRPFVVVSNHQSLIDPFIMVQNSPNGTAPLAKKSLLYVPIFGVASWLCGTVFINRSKGMSAIEVMHKVGLQMKKKNTSFWIFAEGTRRQLDRVCDFKKGAFHLAIQAQVPIVPVVIGNSRNAIDTSNRLFEGGEIRVKAFPPIHTEGLSSEDVNDLLGKVHQIISDGFDEDFRKHAEIYKDLIPLKSD